MNKEEITLAKYHIEQLKQQRKHFEYADTSQYLLEQQKEDDLIILQDAFVGWIGKVKQDDPRGKEFNLLLRSIWRIQSYCGNLETICRAAVVKVVQHEKRIKQLESENRLLKLESDLVISNQKTQIKKLEEEIEFTSKNS